MAKQTKADAGPNETRQDGIVVPMVVAVVVVTIVIYRYVIQFLSLMICWVRFKLRGLQRRSDRISVVFTSG